MGRQCDPVGWKKCDGSGIYLTQHIVQEWTTYDVDDVAAGLQEFLICVEMFFAALAHAHSFPPRDYMDPAGGVPRGFKQNIRIMFDVTDVVDDVQGVVDDTVSALLQLACPSVSCQQWIAITFVCSIAGTLQVYSAWERTMTGMNVQRIGTGMRGSCCNLKRIFLPVLVQDLPLALCLTACSPSSKKMLAAAHTLCDVLQVMQTNKRITKAGKSVWTHTKQQTDRVVGVPKKLFAKLHSGSHEALDDSDEDVEGRSLRNYR